MKKVSKGSRRKPYKIPLTVSKFWIYLFLFPFALHLFSLFCLHFNESFHIAAFEHGFKKTYATEVFGLDYSQLDALLSQPYHYLGHGKQMIAFESEDKTIVLKLFNPMRPLKKKWYTKVKFWKRYSSLKWISREWFQKNIRLKKLFQRHKLAYEYLKDETGLLFVHLSPSKRICHQVHITDNKGKNHILALSKIPFVLQEKAILVPNYLQNLIQNNEEEQVRLALANIESLFEKRMAVGITDRIQTMRNNYGFVGTKPIQIDVGRIRFDPKIKEAPNEERNRILNNFRDWLKTDFPQLTYQVDS